MSKVLNDDLIYGVLAVVDEIPEGKVVTYGQIAKLIDKPKNARLVGRVLSMAGEYGEYPCHQLVNHAGRLAPEWEEQRELLEAENIPMKNDMHVKINKYEWKI